LIGGDDFRNQAIIQSLLSAPHFVEHHEFHSLADTDQAGQKVRHSRIAGDANACEGAIKLGSVCTDQDISASGYSSAATHDQMVGGNHHRRIHTTKTGNPGMEAIGHFLEFPGQIFPGIFEILKIATQTEVGTVGIDENGANFRVLLTGDRQIVILFAKNPVDRVAQFRLIHGDMSNAIGNTELKCFEFHVLSRYQTERACFSFSAEALINSRAFAQSSSLMADREAKVLGPARWCAPSIPMVWPVM